MSKYTRLPRRLHITVPAVVAESLEKWAAAQWSWQRQERLLGMAVRMILGAKTRELGEKTHWPRPGGERRS